MPQFSPGEIILNGKYRIETPLGEGAFGEVYLATHLNLKALRALKVMRKEGDSGAGSTLYGNARRRFLQESKIGARLGNHPHIIQVMDFEEVEDLLMLALEYAPGGSLRDRLESLREEGKPMPVADALRIAIETAEGLALLHKMDVVHRDLKPGNILFDKEGYAKVADFGLAQVPHGESQRSVFSQPEPHPGTPGYMSPEQKSPPYDILTPASDIYALGAVLFEMLTGRSQYMQRPGTRPSDLQPGVLAGLDEVVLRMLAQNPQERPWGGAEAARLLQACAQALEGSPRVQEGAHVAEQESAEQARRVAEEIARRELETARQELQERENTRLKAETQARLNAEEKARREQETQLLVQTVSANHSDTSAAARVGSRKSTPIWGWLLGVPVLLVLIFFAVRGIKLPASITLEPTRAPLAVPTTMTLTAEPTVAPVVPTAIPTTEPASASVVVHTAAPTNELTAASTAGASVPPACTEIGQTWVSPVDGMTLVCVPAGKFTMGSNDSDDEKPIHEVYLDAYWMDQTEVTNVKYARCVAAGDCGVVQSPGSHSRGSYYGNSSYDDYPVITVDWNQASAYCTWAGRDLPTEAQWEKASRGTDGRSYPWGNAPPGTNLLNYNYNTGDTTEVGSYPDGASPYGALDMAGNVWEYVADWYGAYPYGELSNPTGPGSGENRVMRGGSWGDSEYTVRASSRYPHMPFGVEYMYGFRCSLSVR